MTTLTKQAGAQWRLVGQFRFTAADAMVNTSGALANFKAATGTVYDILALPPFGQVVGGDLVVTTVSNDSGTSTVSVGDAASATRYLAATNLKAAARTALTITGRISTGENIRITVANGTGDATTLDATITVEFVVQGRVNENLKTT